MILALTVVSLGTMIGFLLAAFILHARAKAAAARLGFNSVMMLQALTTRSNYTEAIAAGPDMNERAILKMHLRRLSIGEFILIPLAGIFGAIGIHLLLRL